MVLLAECFDWHSSKLTGRRALFNVSADPSQTKDLAAQRPATVAKLQDRIEEYGAQGATYIGYPPSLLALGRLAQALLWASGLTQATCSCRDGEGGPATAGDSRTVGGAVGSTQRGATGRGVEQLLLCGLPAGCAAEAEGCRRARPVSGVGAVVRHARGASVPRVMLRSNGHCDTMIRALTFLLLASFPHSMHGHVRDDCIPCRLERSNVVAARPRHQSSRCSAMRRLSLAESGKSKPVVGASCMLVAGVC